MQRGGRHGGRRRLFFNTVKPVKKILVAVDFSGKLLVNCCSSIVSLWCFEPGPYGDLYAHVAQNDSISSKNQNYTKSFQRVKLWVLINTSVSFWDLNMYFEIDGVFD